MSFQRVSLCMAFVRVYAGVYNHPPPAPFRFDVVGNLCHAFAHGSSREFLPGGLNYFIWV